MMDGQDNDGDAGNNVPNGNLVAELLQEAIDNQEEEGDDDDDDDSVVLDGLDPDDSQDADLEFLERLRSINRLGETVICRVSACSTTTSWTE